MHQRNVVVMPEQIDHGLGFIEPQHAVIDEHASELVADRLVDQHRGDRGIDAAGKAADHLALAYLGADLLDRLLAERAHGPVAGEACDLADEIADQFGAVRRVHHFGVELHRVEFALVVGDHRNRRTRGLRHRAKTVGQLGDAVAMAHPDVVASALLPDAVEQRAVVGDLDGGAAELAVMPALDGAAELLGHGLLAVADAEHRHAGIEDRHRRGRRIVVEHGSRPAGEDHGFRLHLLEGRFGLLERHDLGIDALLAHPARDQLRHLAAEIDNQNLVMRRGHRGRRLCGRLWGCHGQQIRDGARPRNPAGRVRAALFRPSTPFDRP